LKNSQVAALSTPRPPAPEPRPDMPRLPRPDVIRLFEPLKQTIGLIEKYYIEQRDEGTLYAAANNALRRAFPPSAMEARFAAADAGKGDLDSVYDAAFAVLNAQTSGNEDNHAVEVAINGVLASLDPYSFYMSALAFRAQQSQTSGTFGGIGVEINVIDGLLRVMSPIDGTPAAKAGILANDVIVAIDGVSTQGLPTSALASRMRGAVGSPVKLKILRDNVGQPIELTIVRDIVRTQSVRAHVEGGDVGYIRITRFDEQTESSFKQAVADISRQAGSALKGYVIDLRNNAGGLLASVTAVADDIMDSGEIASIRGRNAKDDHPVTAHAGDVTGGTRLVVLINGGSASGSEIVAGALQDNQRATIVGTQSRGYGNIRTIFPLGPGHGAVELTTALYYTPSGRSVQATGITPDIEALQDEPTKPGKAHIAEAALTGRLPVVGVPVLGTAHGVSQSYIPPDPAKDRALVTALDILRTGSSYPRRCSTGPCAPAWLGPWLLNPRMTGL
jgi:carboxyl-terminal processing protease